MPYGETWIDEVSNKNVIDYKFTGKEYDPETGLYYFGARYLDPVLSRWISSDPAIGDYLPVAPVNDEAKKKNGNLPGQGGVFNSVNMALYHYAGNNPIKYVDPDGEVSETVLLQYYLEFLPTINGVNSNNGYTDEVVDMAWRGWSKLKEKNEQFKDYQYKLMGKWLSMQLKPLIFINNKMEARRNDGPKYKYEKRKQDAKDSKNNLNNNNHDDLPKPIDSRSKKQEFINEIEKGLEFENFLKTKIGQGLLLLGEILNSPFMD